MKTLARMALAIVALLATANATLAAEGGDGFPLTPVREAPASWGAIICSILLLIVICAAAFKNARRSHLN